jgi:hypothetical protein
LGRGEKAEGDEHGGIDGASVEEECANDCLESSDFGFVKFGGCVFFFCELGRRTVEWLGPGRGSMLGAAFGRVFETSEGFGDVAGAGFVVPLESDAAVEGAGPIGCHFVFGGGAVDEVLGISLPVYWRPKSSRTRLNMTGQVSCLKRPGVCSSWWYPFLAR